MTGYVICASGKPIKRKKIYSEYYYIATDDVSGVTLYTKQNKAESHMKQIKEYIETGFYKKEFDGVLSVKPVELNIT